jgi:DNA-binding protein H-NS
MCHSAANTNKENEMATLEKIQAQVAKLQAQADTLIAKQSSTVLANIRAIMEKHGLTTADIDAYVSGAKKRGRKPGASAVNGNAKATIRTTGGLRPKYRDPKTGATWSGHARPPAWIKDVKDRTRFLISGASATVPAEAANKSKVTAKPATKAASKSKLLPKYLNPKTGATWSGHARPPAWIKDVKDRTRFLIAGDAALAAAANLVTASKAKTRVKNASAVGGAGAHTGQRNGPQPAKYRDPKSGATWSGRGPAPVWLAAVKDRTRFLIEGAALVTIETGAVNKASTPDAAGKSGAITKKATAKKMVTTKAPAAKKVVATKKAATKRAQAKDVAPASNAVVATKTAAPAAKKVAVKKAPARKAVAKAVVATPEVATAPAPVAVELTA